MALLWQSSRPASGVPVWAGEGAERVKRAVAKMGSDWWWWGGRGWKEFLEKKVRCVIWPKKVINWPLASGVGFHFPTSQD